MSEIQSNPPTEFEELLSQEEFSGVIKSGSIKEGTVSRITNEKIYVDLGAKFEGELSTEAFEADEMPAEGDSIQVKVIKTSDKESIIFLKRATDRFTRAAKKFKEVMDSDESLSAKIEKAVKGGAIAHTDIGNVFIPLPLLADRYVEKADDFVGKEVKIKIVSVNEKRKSIRASSKEFFREEKRKAEEELWDKLEVGALVTGTVKNFTDYRAFVDLGGIDGSIHISEISWNRIKHPSDVLNIGDKVEVKIIKLDPEKKRISLQLKKAEDNPWYMAEEKYTLDSVVKGKVARIVPFGAFVELAPGVDALVHISQISDFRLAKVEEALSVGDEIEGKIIEVDIPAQKISLSIKEVEPINPPERVAEAEARQKERDERDAERARKAEERRVAFEERAAKRAAYEAKKAEMSAVPKTHVEELTTTIGDLSALADIFKNEESKEEDTDNE